MSQDQRNAGRDPRCERIVDGAVLPHYIPIQCKLARSVNVLEWIPAGSVSSGRMFRDLKGDQELCLIE